ncbi:MAG: hypothetical protein QOH51_3676 [Acidobacteriota bacterium]|jgi:tetratricopeptide (TPR) repeat protein|nr:hypothetical protein [Acidobacteriota bacterium]
MDAMISGRAGVALLVEGQVFSSFDVEDPATLLPRRPADLRLLFGEAPDIEFFEDVNHAEAARHLERAFNCASALDLALILFDPELTDDLRDDTADELERLLSDPTVADYLENVLYGRPLPAATDLAGAQARCKGGRLPKLSATLQILEGYQPAIRAVRAAWDDLPAQLFGGDEQKAEFQHVAVHAGLFRQLAIESAAHGAGVGQILLRSLLNPVITTLKNHREILGQWINPFRRLDVTLDMRREADEYLGQESRTRRGRRGKRKSIDREAVLKNVRSQKARIVEAMQRFDLERARKIVGELVSYQLENGEPIHAVKSLCDLAIEAKALGIHSLQLDLTERAIQIAPDDGWSWAQYADALLKLQRPTEALKAYEQAESFGTGVVAKNGRAETLRSLGRLPEALAAYDDAVSEHPESVVAKRGRAEALKALGRLGDALAAYDAVLAENLGDVIAKNGRAETLRALGRLAEALAAYDDAVSEHPEDVVAKTGRAETLRSLGRLPEALAAYDDAVSEHPENVIAKNGRAETLRALGRLPEALAAYDDAVSEYPENVVAKSGRAETLRALGRLPEALAAYDDAVSEHPENVIAKTGRAETLRALGRLPEALAAYDDAVSEYPENVVARTGRSCILAALHRYDEALQYLPNENPTLLQDWIGYHIRGMILLRMGKVDEALRIFEHGVREDPIPSSKEYFRSALAVARLRRGDFVRAGSVLDEVTAPLLQPQANVLRLHSFGATGDTKRAAAAYQKLRDRPWSVSDELVEELNRKYILKEEPRYDDDWIFDKEVGSLLLVANQQVMSFSLMAA